MTLNVPDFKRCATLSIVVALGLAAASLAGLLAPGSLYPAEDLRRAFLANDLVNLLVGLPALLISLELARRGRWLGLLLWPGALFYVIYNYLAYAWAQPGTLAFGFYLALVLVSLYTLVSLLARSDRAAVQRRLRGAVPERWGGGVLVVLGALFLLRALAGIVAPPKPPSAPELAVLIADLLTTPAWVIGGIALWRRTTWGYLGGPGLLFQASLLFVALIAFLLLQPLFTGAPLALADVAVIAVMGLVCFIPCGLFIRAMK